MIKTFICATFAFTLLIPLMEDITVEKKLCPCTKNLFLPAKVFDEHLNYNYTQCKDGARYPIKFGKPDRTAPEQCGPDIFERFNRLDFGMRCFDNQHCTNLAISSAQFIGAFFSFGIGYPSIAMLIIFSSFFGFTGEPGKQTFGLKSKFGLLFGGIGLGVNNREHISPVVETVGSVVGVDSGRGVGGRYKRKTGRRKN